MTRPAVHQNQPVHEARGEGEVVDHRKHAGPGMGPVAQDLHHMELVVGVQRGDRLVHEQDRRLDGKRPGKQHARALATREYGYWPVR